MSLLSHYSLKESAADLSPMDNIDLKSLGFANNVDLETWFSNVLYKYNKSIQVFEPLSKMKLNSKRTVYKTTQKNKVLIHSISKKLSLFFSIRNSSRNSNIIVLSNIFTSNNRITIMKLDISKFFDSIPHDKLVEIIRKNRILNTNDINLIIHYLDSNPSSKVGVHQGTELSNVLSEVFFSSLDKTLKTIDNSLIFSERYVDDILLVFNRNFHDDEVKEFYARVKDTIESYQLSLNDQKTKIVSIYMNKHYKKITETSSIATYTEYIDYLKLYSLSKKGAIHKIKKTYIDFSYLGYRFNWNLNKAKNICSFHIDIPQTKIYKYKTRAYKLFSEFKKHRSLNPKRNDFAYYLLRERLRFLTSTYVLPAKKNDYTKSIIGINSNYQYIQNQNQILELHRYLKNNIYYLFKHSMITKLQMQNLMLIIMQNRKFISFTTMSISTLKSWISAMSPTVVVFPLSLSNHYLRKRLTAMYMKSVKI
ncbi:MAG: RNA-directed DNA polymerase [Acholeplasmataceae bacterium]|nr:RNA-directed DNA polymerase [Acholeplasmataceae bacterium]